MGRKRYTDGGNKTPSFFIRDLTPKNDIQAYYISTIKESTVTFCTGPAGTGKTFIAAYIALDALLRDEIDKVILTRPIVAIEDIGYLPGTFEEKIHPYVLPLFDAIDMHVGPTKARDLLSTGRIEVLPLAYMRGRSLNNSFLILDEAQNTTQEQMKMFLTRIGYGSKICVTGDATQSDLKGQQNGLSWAVERLKGAVEDITVVEFNATNIVRHPLIETMLARLAGQPAKPHSGNGKAHAPVLGFLNKNTAQTAVLG